MLGSSDLDANATATLATRALVGTHTLSAAYRGDAVYAPSARSTTVVTDEALPPLAGADQTVDSGATTAVDALASTDPQGLLLGFAWSQVAGPPVTIDDPKAPRTTVRVPAGPATVQLRVTVTNERGHFATDDVIINVRAPKQRGLVTRRCPRGGGGTRRRPPPLARAPRVS